MSGLRVHSEEADRAEELHTVQPDTPAVGKWYWVRSEEGDGRSLACVTHLGSNYAKLTFIGSDERSQATLRLHHDTFWSRCEYVEDAGATMLGNAERCKRELSDLLEEVKLLTTKLGVSPSAALGAGEVASTSLALAAEQPVIDYKSALVRAKEETLPELFGKIKEKSAEYGMWLTGQVIPMQAEAEKFQPAIARVTDRIFSVELYAGLCEEVRQVRAGAPAEFVEPVHLFQRRLYMDEECLANYDTGGMVFKDLRAFERWLCRGDNLERVLPFPRTVVAFRVRRHEKEREIANLREFVRVLEDKPLDKLTFLYIRNGSRIYRLSTAIDFGAKLFPDVDHPVLSAGEGRLYADLSEFRDEYKIIGEAEYLAMVAAEEEELAEYKRKIAEEKKKPKKDRQYVSSPSMFSHSSRYEPFTKASVHYDDIAKYLRTEMEKHNRIVLVLQGLLDRSPALHPHPPWRLFEAAGFDQAIVLHRDSDRVLVAGDKPDFEAYRSKLNASIRTGSVTVGQEKAWLRFEAAKESQRRDSDPRWTRVDWRPEEHRPDGDPGPGRFARVTRVDGQDYVHYRWTKERRGGDGPPVERKYACSSGRVLNVDAYQAGDYKRFFSDPRTREEYLQWAPLLLAAEEYKAGRHGEAPPLVARPEPKRKPSARGGMSEYARRKMLRGFLGDAVRLRRPIETRDGKKYEKDSLWRVASLARGEFSIYGIDAGGKVEEGENERSIRCVSHRDFYVETSVPPDPKYVYKETKRERPPVVDRLDESED